MIEEKRFLNKLANVFERERESEKVGEGRGWIKNVCVRMREERETKKWGERGEGEKVCVLLRM